MENRVLCQIAAFKYAQITNVLSLHVYLVGISIFSVHRIGLSKCSYLELLCHFVICTLDCLGG